MGSARTLGGLAAGMVRSLASCSTSSTRNTLCLDPRLFTNRRLSAGSLSICIQFFAFFGFTFVSLQYLEGVRGYTPLIAALAVLPLSATMMPAARLTPGLVTRFGARTVCVTGLLLCAVGLFILSRIGTDTPYWLMLAGLVPLGIGMGAAMTPATTAITEALPQAEQGVGSALNDLSREVGGALGTAVIGSVVTAVYSSSLQLPGAPAPLVDKARSSFAVAIHAGGSTGAHAQTPSSMASTPGCSTQQVPPSSPPQRCHPAASRAPDAPRSDRGAASSRSWLLSPNSASGQPQVCGGPGLSWLAFFLLWKNPSPSCSHITSTSKEINIMSPHRSDTFDPGPSPEHPSWILTADMAGPPDRVLHPRSRNLALRRRWRRTRRLRAARRAGWLVFVAAVITLVQSGFGPATSSGASQPAPHTSQPQPSAGLITFYLALPAHASSLVNDAVAAAMPNSAHYRHFSSVATLSAKYGASNGTMQRVSGDIQKLGLIAAIDPSRLFARVTGTAGQWASALKAPLHEQPATPENPYETYSLPAAAPERAATERHHVAVHRHHGVRPEHGRAATSTGLPSAKQRWCRPRSPAEPWPKNTGTVGPLHCDQSAITSGEVYTPTQVQTAYGVTGLAAAAGSASPSIDVIDLGGGWNPSDLQAAGACFGYGSVHVTQSQGDGVATPIKSTDPETSLDLQTTAAVAPKASIHLIQASDGPASLLDGFSRALGEPGGTPDVATLSYGGCGVADAITASTYVTITNEVLAMLAMSGTSTFIAAGDNGSTTCPGPGLVPTLSFPAVSPWSPPSGEPASLSTLKTGGRTKSCGTTPSTERQRPEGVDSPLTRRAPPTKTASTRPRNAAVPDVSVLADIEPGWPVFVDGTLEPVGGTSGSSPFVAAATALVDAQQRAQHEPRIGLANGWFYQADRRNPASFYDVTQGDNQLKLVTCCSAATGYDQASGLGVPDWSVLARPAAKPCTVTDSEQYPIPIGIL